VVKARNMPGGVSLSLRTFQPGEYKALLGGKEIVLEVRSTLDEIQREGIFEWDADAAEARLPFDGRVLFYIAAGIFLLPGAFILIKALQKRIRKTPGALQRFLRRSGALSMEDDHYFVNVTLCFKEYLETLYTCRIIGMTSAEIIAELKGKQAFDAALPETQAWLRECDRLKFTGVPVSKEDKQRLYGELLNLAAKIDAQKEGAV